MVITFITDNLKEEWKNFHIRASNHSITPNLDYYGTRVEFNGSCLKQDSVTFNQIKVVNIYIVYEASKSLHISDYPILENCLSGTVSLTKNADIDSYGYLDMESGLIGMEVFHFLALDLGET